MKLFILLIFLILNLYSKEILGEIDKFDLPQFNIKNMEARIDTGASSSSLHCTNIKELDNNLVQFRILGKYKFIKPILKVAKVKSSNGEIQSRYFIKSNIIIFGKNYDIELSLNNREKMKYPLLIGRELLKKDFIVDVSLENLSFKNKK